MSNPDSWKQAEDSFSIYVEDERGEIIADVRNPMEDMRIPLQERMESHRARARLLAAAPDLLHELKLANKIIMNALNVMTTDQKLAWDEMNARDDLKDGWALTRNKARESAIAKAEGRTE